MKNLKSHISNLKSGQGFVALSTVLIICAVMLATVFTVTSLAIGEGQASLSLALGEDNLHLVESCTEDLLSRVRSNSAFSGATITLPTGSCAVSYTSSGPTNWDVTVASNDTKYKRKIRVVFTRSTSITLTSWQEI